jgi:ppGpp synthetase/RelA/SpoT-type nucleotidyltranferase
LPDRGDAEVPEIDFLKLSEMYLEVAQDFMDAANHLKRAVTDLVGDTFPEDPPLIDFQARQKKLESIAQKAAAWGWDTGQVRQKMRDLTGVRLICLHFSQIADLVSLLHELERRSIIDIKKEESWIEKPQESGYRGVHLDVEIKLPRQKREGEVFVELPCEIQVRTLIQHAWAERAHGLIHKPDHEPSEQIKNLFRIESLRLHGHQQTMDALWEMALWERKIRETEESINPLTVKALAREFDPQLTDQQAMNLYQSIRAWTAAERIEELREILSNDSIQTAIREIYEAELRRQPDITGRLLYGSLLHYAPGNGRFRAELDIISSPEFRGKESLPFNFNVTGRIDHTFESFQEKAGGWQTYHSHDHKGTVRSNFDETGAPDGVELRTTVGDSIFRAAYPYFALAYPGRAVVADFTLEGNSHFFVLATTVQHENVFFEFGCEYEETSETVHPNDGTRYVRSHAKTIPGEPSVSVNLSKVVESAGLSLDLQLIHGFYCEANPRMVLRKVEVYKSQLTGA